MTPIVFAGLLLWDPSVQAVDPFTADDVIVTEQSPRPEEVSGVYAAFIMIQARQGEDGGNRRYYFPYQSESQQFPQPGARCYFWHHRRRIEVVGGFSSPPDLEGDVVTAYDCGPRPIQVGED